MTFQELYDKLDAMLMDYGDKFQSAYGIQREYYDGYCNAIEEIMSIVAHCSPNEKASDV